MIPDSLASYEFALRAIRGGGTPAEMRSRVIAEYLAEHPGAQAIDLNVAIVETITERKKGSLTMARRRKASDVAEGDEVEGVEGAIGVADAAIGRAKEQQTPPANTAVRASIQLTAFRRLWELDRDIKAAREQHIASLQENRSEVWKTLRNDLGAEAADLKPLYALYKRDRELQESDDWEKAQRSQDVLREAFETLREGETLNFLNAI